MPNNAAGTTRPQNRTTALGAPVAVIGGPATLVVSTLTQGARWLTEVLTPGWFGEYSAQRR
ncbi:MAG: hypothetical protein ACRDSF_21335 [Pseudonocardiaceae bacterium]